MGEDSAGRSTLGRPSAGFRRPVLELRNVSVTWGGREILSDVVFSLGKGEILGIAGFLGAGPTELLEILSVHEYPIFAASFYLMGNRLRSIPLPTRSIMGLRPSPRTSKLPAVFYMIALQKM